MHQGGIQNTDQVLACITTAANGFLIVFLELLFADVAVITLQLLLGHQLNAEIGRLRATLAVLAGAVFTVVHR